MKKLHTINSPIKQLALCLGLLVFSLGGAAETVTLDRVIAVVDEDVVMESELQEQLQGIVQRLRQQGTELPPENILKQQVLEHLIVQRLQLQVANRADVKVEDQEIDDAVVQMQRTNNLSHEQFIQQLQLEGLSLHELRESVRQELLIQRVQRGVLNSRIKITEHDVNSFLNSKEGQFWNSPELLVGHILIPISSGASDSAVTAAEEQVRSLREQIINGADFRQIATTYSSGQNALQGGDLGWTKAAELPTLFAENLDGLQAGEVTQPFRSGAGFHLLTIHDQRGNTQAVIEQSKVRHILLIPSAILTEEQAKAKLLSVREEALEKNNFPELAKEHSDDIGSMLNGGDLGWSLPGQFVPEFEAVMNATPVGEISHPFRTQHGWHILMVEDRRDQDMSEEVKRNQARNLLRNRRFEEELPLWLQEIRSEAFVDVKVAELKPAEDGDN